MKHNNVSFYAYQREERKMFLLQNVNSILFFRLKEFLFIILSLLNVVLFPLMLAYSSQSVIRLPYKEIFGLTKTNENVQEKKLDDIHQLKTISTELELTEMKNPFEQINHLQQSKRYENDVR